MALGFSVGDIFAGIDFIRSTIDALASGTGSKAQYEGVIGTLKSFEAALGQLAALEAHAAERQFVEEIVDRITTTIAHFTASISKYRLNLGSAGSQKWWRSALRKIQWQQYSKDDVRWFHEELLRHASALQLGLAKIQSASTTRQGQQIAAVATNFKTTILSRMDDQDVETCRRLDRFDTAAQVRSTEMIAEAALLAERTCLTLNTRHDSAEVAAARRHHASYALIQRRFDEVERAASARDTAAKARFHEIKMMLCILFLEWCKIIYQALSRLPPLMPTQASTIFEDAHGSIFHISTQFIQSWQAFQFVLEDNFRNKPGHLRVTEGRFLLYDRLYPTSIDRRRPFQAVFKPGRHIQQGVVFKREELANPHCPRCNYESDVIGKVEVKCIECGMNYRHYKTSTTTKPALVNVTVMSDDDQAPKPSTPSDVDEPSDFARIVIQPFTCECGWSTFSLDAVTVHQKEAHAQDMYDQTIRERFAVPNFESIPSKGHDTYADNDEYPTPDDYSTEHREHPSKRIHHTDEPGIYGERMGSAPSKRTAISRIMGIISSKSAAASSNRTVTPQMPFQPHRTGQQHRVITGSRQGFFSPSNSPLLEKLHESPLNSSASPSSATSEDDMVENDWPPRYSAQDSTESVMARYMEELQHLIPPKYRPMIERIRSEQQI